MSRPQTYMEHMSNVNNRYNRYVAERARPMSYATASTNFVALLRTTEAFQTADDPTVPDIPDVLPYSPRCVDAAEEQDPEPYGMDCGDGEPQGWPISPSLLPEAGDPVQYHGPPTPRPGRPSWELSSLPLAQSGDEVCPEGWTIHLEHRRDSPFSCGSVSRGPLTSPCWKRRRGDRDHGEQPEGMPRPSAPRGDDPEELPLPSKKRKRGDPTRNSRLQLDDRLGPIEDANPVRPDGDWEDSSSEGSSWGSTSSNSSHGSTEGSGWSPFWSDL